MRLQAKDPETSRVSRSYGTDQTTQGRILVHKGRYYQSHNLQCVKKVKKVTLECLRMLRKIMGSVLRAVQPDVLCPALVGLDRILHRITTTDVIVIEEPDSHNSFVLGAGNIEKDRG